MQRRPDARPINQLYLLTMFADLRQFSVNSGPADRQPTHATLLRGRLEQECMH